MLYLVMKLQSEVSLKTMVGEAEINVSNKNIAGFYPVYKSIVAAENASENGKYKIYALEGVEDEKK